MKISGAGIWHTQLHFTSDQAGGGGFDFLHQDNHVEFSDVYLSSNLRSRYGENARVQGYFWNAREEFSYSRYLG